MGQQVKDHNYIKNIQLHQEAFSLLLPSQSQETEVDLESAAVPPKIVPGSTPYGTHPNT